MQLHTRNPASVSLSASNQLLVAVHDPSAGGSTHPFDVIMPEFGPQTDGSLNPRRRKRKQESVNRFDPMDSKEPLELPSSLFRMQGLGDGQVSDDPVISPTVANKHKDIFKERTSIRKVNKNKKILHEHEILGIEPYRVKLLGGIRNLPEEMYRKEKEESEKLRMMVAALQNQLEVLLDFAARGTTKKFFNCINYLLELQNPKAASSLSLQAHVLDKISVFGFISNIVADWREWDGWEFEI